MVAYVVGGEPCGPRFEDERLLDRCACGSEISDEPRADDEMRQVDIESDQSIAPEA